MAKTETTKETAATVASKAAAKVAAEVLKRNPDFKEVHVTSDGTAFYTRNDAQNHANSLPNREVFSIKRKAALSKSDTAPAVAVPEYDNLTEETVNDEPAKTDE